MHDAYDGDPPLEGLGLFDGVAEPGRTLVAQMLRRDLNAPRAHGLGRYFDAFGAMVLGRPLSTYEGQVAVAWDFTADDLEPEPYPFEIDWSRMPAEIDLRSMTRAVVADMRAGVLPGRIASRFHDTLVEATTNAVQTLLSERGPMPVALTGGVFQNARLVAGVTQKLTQDFKVLRHREVPPGDGGIALGQALIAGAVSRDKGGYPKESIACA